MSGYSRAARPPLSGQFVARLDTRGSCLEIWNFATVLFVSREGKTEQMQQHKKTRTTAGCPVRHDDGNAISSPSGATSVRFLANKLSI